MELLVTEFQFINFSIHDCCSPSSLHNHSPIPVLKLFKRPTMQDDADVITSKGLPGAASAIASTMSKPSPVKFNTQLILSFMQQYDCLARSPQLEVSCG